MKTSSTLKAIFTVAALLVATNVNARIDPMAGGLKPGAVAVPPAGSTTATPSTETPDRTVEGPDHTTEVPGTLTPGRDITLPGVVVSPGDGSDLDPETVDPKAAKEKMAKYVIKNIVDSAFSNSVKGIATNLTEEQKAEIKKVMSDLVSKKEKEADVLDLVR